MRFFYDCEFLENGATIELISIGIVGGDGREYYAVNADMPELLVRDHTWLLENVWPHLPTIPSGDGDGWLDVQHPLVKPRRVIAHEVHAFLTHGLADGERAELWAYYGAYDHVTLAQLWGPMVRLPPGIPMWTHELMQLWELAGRPELPAKPADAHDALADARWNAQLHTACMEGLALLGGS